MKNIIIIDMEVDPKGLEKLKAIDGISFEIVPEIVYEERRSFPKELIADKHMVFCSGLPPLNLEDMKSLKLIQIASAGYSQLFNIGLVEREIKVCNAAGVNDIPIAEWNITMMDNLLRDLRRMIRNQESSIWERPAVFQRELRGLKVGVWGYGGIGRETARHAKNMGMVVYAMDAYPVGPRLNFYSIEGTGDPEGVLPDRVFTLGQEKDFLSSLDFLVLSMPLTKKTEGIISEEYLKMLPPTAYVLNPARGPLIKEAALLSALREGWIAGAALDTHYYYPMPADHPLWQFPNVIMTPHISGSTLSPHYNERVWDVFVQNAQRFADGEPLLNELTEAKLMGQ